MSVANKASVKAPYAEMQKIENIRNNNSDNKNFLKTKNIILISFGIILSIVLLTLTFIYVFDIKWEQLFTQIHGAFNGRFAGLWLISLLLFLISKFLFTYIVFTIRLKKDGIKVCFSQKLLYTLTIWFLMSVTPANFVTDPYTIFWLKTQGLKTHKASALVLSSATIWQVIQIIVTLPSFIVICIQYNSFAADSDGLIVFWFMVVGLSIDFASLSILVLFMVNKHIHMYASILFNKIKKWCHIKYATKDQIREKYLVKATLFNELKAIIKDWKITFIVAGWFFFFEIYMYLLMFFSLKFIGYKYELNCLNIFNCANVAITANKMIPIPGGEYTIEKFLIVSIKNLGGISPRPETSVSTNVDDLIKNGVLIWRSFSSYIPTFFGIFGFVAMLVNNFIKIKNKKIFAVKNN